MAIKNLYEYYTSKGQKLPSVEERKSVYEQAGLGQAQEYRGTAEQNISLLQYLTKQQRPLGAFSVTEAKENLEGVVQKINPSLQKKEVETEKTEEEEIERLNQQLTKYQNNQEEEEEEEEIKTRESTELLKTIMGQAKLPEAPDISAEYGKLRTEYGLDPLEGQITQIDAQIADIEAGFREKTGEERFISKGFRTTETRKLAEETQKQIDALNRQKKVAVDQLNTKYTAINNIIDLKKLDYQTARDEYEFNFNKNLALIQLLSKEEQYEIGRMDKEEQVAQATWETMSGAIQESLQTGTIESFDQLSDSVQASIRKLEMQIGLPEGFTSQVLASIDVEREVVNKIISKDKTKMSVIYDDGSVEVFSTGLPTEDEAEEPIEFTDSQKLKLEQAGLLNAPRKDQLDFLYKDIGKEMGYTDLEQKKLRANKINPLDTEASDTFLYRGEQEYKKLIQQREIGMSVGFGETLKYVPGAVSDVFEGAWQKTKSFFGF